jgi:pimeloyl-ACP methyl ester carboxylesterase
MTGLGLDGDLGGTFPFEARYINVADVRLHYVDEGPRDAPAILFVHGNPTWSYLWRRPLAELSQQGRRCVALDHMGFGRSDKPAHPSAANAADCSWRTSTMSTPSSRQPS